MENSLSVDMGFDVWGKLKTHAHMANASNTELGYSTSQQWSQ